MTLAMIGISFGSSNSCITLAGPVAVTIANEDGDRQVPSVVAFTGYELLVGSLAKHQKLGNPQGTIEHFRALLGTDTTYQTNHHDTNLEIEQQTQTHTVEQVTTIYLRALRISAEAVQGSAVHGCLLGIPAQFDDKQKTSLLRAAKVDYFNFRKLDLKVPPFCQSPLLLV
jgi:L1 cell adhesion molecule like protein